MSDLAKTLRTYGLQADVRGSMQHTRNFQVEMEIPKAFRDKLAEIDRAAVAQSRKV